MAIDHARVSQIIQKALDNNQRSTIKESLEWAWREVNSIRERGGASCADQDLAAADHYLFARYNTYSYPGLAVIFLSMTFAYDGIYKGFSAIIKRSNGKEIVFETGKCPPSNFSPTVFLWGRAGVKNGLEDAVKQKKKLTAPNNPYSIIFLRD